MCQGQEADGEQGGRERKATKQKKKSLTIRGATTLTLKCNYVFYGLTPMFSCTNSNSLTSQVQMVC